MSLSLDFKKIKHLIKDRTLVLTPNSRTQKAIISGQLKSLSVGSVVESLRIFSLSQWLETLWSELSFYQVLPKKVSELVVKSWIEEQILQETEWTLTNPSGVANKALEAYKNLVLWDLSLEELIRSGTISSIEVDYFVKWMSEFEHFSKERHLIADFLCLKLLNDNLNQLKNILPQHILMVGFDHLTPLENSFIKNLTDNEVQVDDYNFGKATKVEKYSHDQIRFSSLREEIDFAARYSKTFFDQHNDQKESNQSSATLGIVVEQLSNNLAEVHSAFSQAFHPRESKPWVTLEKPNYNVSAGFSLSEQPLIIAALTLLKIKNYQLTREEIHFLKNTPFISWNSEMKGMACESTIRQFLHKLCLSQRQNFSIKYLLKCIADDDSSKLLKPLEAILIHLSNSKSRKRSIQEHIEQWKTRLSLWSWIGFNNERKYCCLDEFESKAKGAFFDSLEQTKEIAHISTSLNDHDAYNFLNQQVSNQVFQIASDHSSVQVLGILEASGLQFDELLVVGFNADNWPQKNKINPFLPLAFQRQYDMPGNSAQREYEYAKRLSFSLLNASQKIIVTSNNESTNQANNEATYFSDLPILVKQEMLKKTLAKVEPCRSPSENKKYEWIDDSNIDLSNQSLFGGAYLLSEYANCPFRSMANFQMRLTGYPVQEAGIEPKAKGSWLHDAMEIIWTQLKSQKELLSLKDEQLNILIEQSLDKALEKHKDLFLATTQQPLVKIEQQKLVRLITEWLTLEKERNEFKVVALEKNYEIQIAALSLKFRVDRIDSVQIMKPESTTSNTQMASRLDVIDYKTGAVNVNNWFGVRPTEAQMPAYIIALEAEKKLDTNSSSQQIISGLSYAQIKTGSVSIQGLSFLTDENKGQLVKHEHNLLKVKDSSLRDVTANNYESLLKDWKSTLDRIAHGITSGWTPVSPKDNDSCTFCDYRAVCRIDEAQPKTKSEPEQAQLEVSEHE